MSDAPRAVCFDCVAPIDIGGGQVRSLELSRGSYRVLVCADERACQARQAERAREEARVRDAIDAHRAQVSAFCARFEAIGVRPAGEFTMCAHETIYLELVDGALLSGTWAILEPEEAPETPTLEALEAARRAYDEASAALAAALDAWRGWAAARGLATWCPIESIADPVGRALRERYEALGRNRAEWGDKNSEHFAQSRLVELEYAARRASSGRSIWLVHRDGSERDNAGNVVAPLRAHGCRAPWSQALEDELRALGRVHEAIAAADATLGPEPSVIVERLPEHEPRSSPPRRVH